MQTVKVFVYGTLKRGFRLNPYMENSKFLAEDTLKGFDIYSNGSFPMIVRGQGEVKGEVFEVPVNLLPILDEIECAYTRTKVNTHQFKGVFVYIYNHDVNSLTPLDNEFKLEDQFGGLLFV